MGDRIQFQVKSGTKFSPVAYGHWSGSSAGDVCRALQERMTGRPADVAYAFARLVQILIGDDDGNTGFGCWNAAGLLTAASSHGDAGVVIIDVAKEAHAYTLLDGYLKLGPDGFPERRQD